MVTRLSLLWKNYSKQWFLYIISLLIIISLIVITIELQTTEEEKIEESFIKNQINIQETITKAISKNISSELELIISEMKNLADEDEIQKDLGTPRSNKIIEQTFVKMNSIAPTAQLLVVDENSVVVSQVSHRQISFVGKKLEGLSSFLNNQKNTLDSKPLVFTIRSPPFLEPEIAMITPIIDKETQISNGYLLVTIPPNQFFAKHGNIYDIESQFLVVLDKNFIILTHPQKELVGHSFYDNSIQYPDSINDLREHYKKIRAGNLDTLIFDKADDSIINSSIPIYVNGKIELLLSIVTPLEAINTEITNIILVNKIQTTIVLLVAASFFGIFFFKLSQIHKKEKLTVIGQLASNVAHDMRNPLGTIRSSSHRIQKQNKSQNPIINDELSRILRSIKRMSHQIEGVLNYVRTTPLTTTKISIKKMLDYALELVEIPGNIKIQLPAQDTVIDCDSEKLEIVFANLIINAIQSIGDDPGTITIRLSEQTKEIQIDFENSGPAIPKDDISKIFKPLFTTKLQGTGLGLSGCKNIIEQHKGKITVTSNPVTFTIVIPKQISK